MPIPPLGPLPHLGRLLAPDEAVLYTAKLHPLCGWPWLAAGLCALGLAWWVKPLLLLALALLLGWWLPLHNFELAVTTRRLLLRHGRLAVETEGILGEKIIEWQVAQTLPQRLLRAGTLRLVLKDSEPLRPLMLRWVWHPFTLVEALEALQLGPRQEPRRG